MKKSTLLLFAVAGMTTLFSAGKAAADFLYVSDSASTDQITAINTSNGTSQLLTSDLLDVPQGVASYGGNVYIADGVSGNITEYNTSTGVFSQFYSGGGLSEAGGMTFDSNGNLFVTNFGNGTISEFTAGSNILTTYATGLSFPTDVVAAGSVLYATEEGGNIAQIFPNGGTGIVLTNFYPGAGSNPALNAPLGITLDAATTGNLFVTAANDNAVYQVTVAPKGTVSISGAGSQLNQPVGLVFNNGYLYVADAGSNEVTEYEQNASNPSTFTFVESFSGNLDNPTYLAFAPGPPVPEPSTYVLLLGGLGALYFYQRRRTTRVLATVKA